MADMRLQPRGGFRPSFAGSDHALEKEGAGKAGCRQAPAVCRAKMHTRKETAQQHTGGADHSAFPARWSDGLCRALPGAECPSGLPHLSGSHQPLRRLTQAPHPQRLDRGYDGQDHTVSPYARFAFPRVSGTTTLCTLPPPHPRDEPISAVRPRAALDSRGSPALPKPLAPDAAASTASPARDQDDDVIAPPK